MICRTVLNLRWQKVVDTFLVTLRFQWVWWTKGRGVEYCELRIRLPADRILSWWEKIGLASKLTTECIVTVSVWYCWLVLVVRRKCDRKKCVWHYTVGQDGQTGSLHADIYQFIPPAWFFQILKICFLLNTCISASTKQSVTDFPNLF